VPYYLIFYPDILDLGLYRLRGGKHVSVKPNREGRYAIRELDLEVGMLGGGVRFWHEGRLLPLPTELQRELDEANRRAAEERRRAAELEQRLREAEEARRAAERELAQLRAQMEQKPARRGNGSKAER